MRKELKMAENKKRRPALRHRDGKTMGISTAAIILYRTALCKCWETICMIGALGCSWLGLLALCAALTGSGIWYFCPAALAVIAVNACLGGYYTAHRMEEVER